MNFGGKRVPLVALRPHEVQRVPKSGLNAHLGKPVSIDRPTAALQRLLEGLKREGKSETPAAMVARSFHNFT